MLTVTANQKTLREAANDTPAFIKAGNINLPNDAQIYHLCAFDEAGELVGAAVLDPEAFDLTLRAIADHLEIEIDKFEVSK